MMAGLVLAVVLAAALFSTVSGGAGIQRVLTLERSFPVAEKVEHDVIKVRDRARHTRVLQSFSGVFVDFPVRGTSDPYVAGLYFTKVRLGSPPQEFNMQIDTGSDISWVTCSSCSDCPQSSGLGVPVNFFDVAMSSTVFPVPCSDNICASIVQPAFAQCSAESNQCGYSFQYGDGSGTTGFYVSDLLSFDTILDASSVVNSSASIVFGCSTSLFGDLTKSDRAVDGIFGLGQQALSVISQLSSRRITPRVFSHCLRGDSNGGGILVLGEILDPRIVYTPLVPSQSHYNINLQSIAVNGQLLPIDQEVFATSGSKGTIVDSGTTLAYLVEGAYDPFVAAVTATVSSLVKPTISKGNQCYLVPTSVNEVFPSVSLIFAGGASMNLRPIDYLTHTGYADGAAMWCIGFVKVRNQDPTILGDLVLKDKIFVYDLAHRRIGWTDHDCSLPVNVSVASTTDEFMNAGQQMISSSSTNLSCNTRVTFVLILAGLLLFLNAVIPSSPIVAAVAN